MKFVDILKEAKKLPSNGDCFDAAYDFMVKNGYTNPDLKLVHGFVSGQGKLSGYRFTHAWCEDNDNVYDYSNGRTIKIPKIIYYAIGNIVPEECKYYNMREFVTKSNQHRFKGPWDIKNEVKKEKWNR